MEEKKISSANGITELVFILDRSGSMGGLENDTVSGFNSMLEEQRTGEGTVLVTTVLFSSSSSMLHDRLNISEVKPLTRREYQVGGGTALLDAIGDTVKHIEDIHRYARPEDVPERTLFVITTDGEENSSRRYSSSEVKKMIKSHEESGWEFLFVADNIDAVETAEAIGIRADRAASYSVGKATPLMYKEMSATISCYRKAGSIRSDWAENIKKDKKDG